MRAKNNLRHRLLNLYTQQDISKEANIGPSVLFNWIEAGLLPAPTEQLGKRKYFTEQQKNEIVKKIKKAQVTK